MDTTKLEQVRKDIENALQVVEDVLPYTMGNTFTTLEQVQLDLMYDESLITELIEQEEAAAADQRQG